MIRRQQACGSTSSTAQTRPMGAVADHIRCICQVGAHGLAAHGHGERCREPPRSGSLARCSGTDFAESFRALQSLSVGNRHSFVIYTMSVKYSVQGFNFQCQGPEIFTPGSPRTHICEKGLTPCKPSHLTLWPNRHAISTTIQRDTLSSHYQRSGDTLAWPLPTHERSKAP